MHEADAGKRAQRPGPPGGADGGTVEADGLARQACAAPTDGAGDETLLLMEAVVRRENLMAAYRRVEQNGGAAGIDGMTVDDLLPHCRLHWERIRKELLGGA